MNIDHIIQAGGLLAIGGMVYAESGIMLGLFLPGDTLLLSAGILASQGKLSLVPVIVVVALAAILGDNTGYHIGRALGPRLFRMKDGIFFRHAYVVRAEKFYEKYGSKTMLLSHFFAIIRSFAPLVAGVAHMSRKQFIIYDAIGDITWAVTTVLVGYWLGGKIPNLDHYILPTFIAVAVLTFVPTLWHLLGNRETRQRLLARLCKPDRT